MDVRHIDHVNLTVADFDDTVAWYGRVFGFDLVEVGMQDGHRWGVIRAGDVMMCLYEHPECRLEDRFSMRARGLHGINHFGLRITDRAGWEATIDREGLEILYGGPVPWPHSTSWYVKDPTGWEIEVALWNDDVITFDPPV